MGRGKVGGGSGRERRMNTTHLPRVGQGDHVVYVHVLRIGPFAVIVRARPRARRRLARIVRLDVGPVPLEDMLASSGHPSATATSTCTVQTSQKTSYKHLNLPGVAVALDLVPVRELVPVVAIAAALRRDGEPVEEGAGGAVVGDPGLDARERRVRRGAGRGDLRVPGLQRRARTGRGAGRPSLRCCWVGRCKLRSKRGLGG